MQTYTDGAGQSWQIELNGWTLKRVRDNAGVLLTSIFDDDMKLFAELHTDPVLLADVVWPLIEEQATAREVTLRQFAESFAGDTVGRARDAVVEATIDFFDDPARRENCRKLLAKMMNAGRVKQAEALAELETMDLA